MCAANPLRYCREGLTGQLLGTFLIQTSWPLPEAATVFPGDFKALLKFKPASVLKQRWIVLLKGNQNRKCQAQWTTSHQRECGPWENQSRWPRH